MVDIVVFLVLCNVVCEDVVVLDGCYVLDECECWCFIVLVCDCGMQVVCSVYWMNCIMLLVINLCVMLYVLGEWLLGLMMLYWQVYLCGYMYFYIEVDCFCCWLFE